MQMSSTEGPERYYENYNDSLTIPNNTIWNFVNAASVFNPMLTWVLISVYFSNISINTIREVRTRSLRASGDLSQNRNNHLCY